MLASASPPAAKKTDEEDDFDFDEHQTVTAWSKSARVSRVRGAFGKKMGPIRLRKKLVREKSMDDSGYLNDEPPSPEVARAPSSLTDDSPTQNEENRFQLNRQPLHQRSSSNAGVLPPKPLRHCFRRYSTAGGSSVRESSSSSSSSVHEYGSLEFPDVSVEQQIPEEEGLQPRERKKFRARRASIQGSHPSLADNSKSFSHIARSAEDWKQIERSSPPVVTKTVDINSELFELPSPARSVASSRKRGVGGSPIYSDLDDLSSTGGLSASNNSSGRHSRSRSRILSPQPAAMPLFLQPLATSRRLPSSPDDERNVMDIDTDDDLDDGSQSDSGSPETSFESTSNHASVFGNGECAHDHTVKNEDDALATMSSYNDLKFTVAALRRESRRRVLAIGAAESWQLAPKTSWPSSRRSAFFQWATKSLGFTIRAMGGSLSFLQISKSKGSEILAVLEAALLVHKRNRKDEASMLDVEEGFNLMDMSLSVRKAPPTLERSAISKPSPGLGSTNDGVTADLMSRMNALTVVDRPLVRHVTDDPKSNLAVPPRDSLDAHAASSDIMFHLHGIEEAPLKRPPRASLPSRNSTGTAGRLSAPLANPIAAAPSFDFVHTPLMQDNDRWGSCPVQGRDWGTSCGCDEAALQELSARFEESCRDAGTRESFICETLDCNPLMPLCPGMQLDLETEGVEVELVNTSIGEMNDRVTFLNSPPVFVGGARDLKKKKQSFAKYKRMSLYFAAADGMHSAVPGALRLFSGRKSAGFADNDKPAGLAIDGFPYDEVDEKKEEFEPYLTDVELSNVTLTGSVLATVLSFLTESELLRKASLVNTSWADAAITAHANLMLASVGYGDDVDDEASQCEVEVSSSVVRSMERSWGYLTGGFPSGQFLSEGGMKKVYRVLNAAVGKDEAVSVMDVEAIVDKKMIAAELAVSSLLSSLARRGICPNFVLTRGVFTCPYEPPESHWGGPEQKHPLGDLSSSPPEPDESYPGRYQYIRMELCNQGDAEEYIKRQPKEALQTSVAQAILFQIAFALHAAADRFSVKHYDVKLLNIFMHEPEHLNGDLVLRYGLGSHVFALRMPAEQAVLAKLADYGTANIKPETNGQPVTIAQFTTLENTPADFMILGDAATQGHGHDCFGLGLCMLHLFTGCAPYEEILEDVHCPPALKKKLRQIWENDAVAEYETIRSVVLSDVYKDEAGHIIEGEPDETLYDTFYRYIVLFGIPEEKFERKTLPKVWNAIEETVVGKPPSRPARNAAKRKAGPDSNQYNRDRRKYSVRTGNNKYIARARGQLQKLDGGLDLLFRLCAFDPSQRATAMDVLNSPFMANLREQPGAAFSYKETDTVYSYTAFATHR